MSIKTFNLLEAAMFLKMSPENLRLKTVVGKIPGAKPGKKWCFLEEDLVEYLRWLYAESAKAPQGESHRRNQLCHSAKEVILGRLDSPTTEEEYKKVLGLPTD